MAASVWRAAATVAWLSLLVVVLAPVAGGEASEGNPAASLDNDPHLVGWWKLDEATGSTAADSSGRGHAGTLRGEFTFEDNSGPGRVGRALQLSGDAGFIEVDGFPGVTGTQSRMVSAWIKTSRPSGQIISWGDEDYGRMWSFGFIRGHLGVTPRGGYLYMNERINDDQWHHVAVVVEAADPPNLHDHVTLYVDGTVATIHDIGLLDLWPIDTGNSQNVTIGKGWEGWIDEVRIYERALGDEELEVLSGTE